MSLSSTLNRKLATVPPMGKNIRASTRPKVPARPSLPPTASVLGLGYYRPAEVVRHVSIAERIGVLGWEEPEEGMNLDYVPGQARPLEINGGPAVALSNAFGFGGHNVVLCLEA
jgi:hypothetical protein